MRIVADDGVGINVKLISPYGYRLSSKAAAMLCRLPANTMHSSTGKLPRLGWQRHLTFAGKSWWLSRTPHEGKTVWWLRGAR